MLHALLLAASVTAYAAPDVSVNAVRSGDGARVEGEFSVPVPLPVAWEVLTDYGEQPRFLTSLRESKVLRRWRGGCLLRQASRLEWWMLRKTVSVTLRIHEQARTEVAFEDESRSDVRRYAGAWTLAQDKGGVRVRYRLEAEPNEWLPGLLVRRALTLHAREALEQVRREMMRRLAAKREMAERFRRRR